MYQLRRKISLLLLASLLLPAALHAAVLDNFYRVEIPAAQEQSRDQALREAFELMLARQAGSEAVGSDKLESALQDPTAYMRRIAGTEDGGVRVEFEPASLRNLLVEAGLPMLGPNRPTVMLWAVENGVVGGELLSQGSEWASALSSAAQRRAVALSLPLADLEDRSLVDVQAVEQADAAILKKASERYDASAVLALTIGGEPGEPILNWHWWLNDQADSGRITADSQAAAADQLMFAVAGRVFDQYAVAPSNTTQASSWEVVVEGIDSVDKFAGLQRTLQQLGSKQVPRVLDVSGDQVRLALDFSGTESQLERLLALDQRLRRMPAPEPAPQPLPEAQPEQATDDSPAGQVDRSLEDGVAAAGEVDLGETAEADMEVSAEPEIAPQPEPETTQNIMYFRWR